MDFPGRSSQPQRAASLNRFRQKRKERCFEKKVRYGVRQEVALRSGDEHVKLLAGFCIFLFAHSLISLFHSISHLQLDLTLCCTLAVFWFVHVVCSPRFRFLKTSGFLISYLNSQHTCRMQRNKGQFTSSKKSDGSYSHGNVSELGQDESPPETS